MIQLYACVIFLSKEETLVEVLFSQTSCIQFWWTLVCDLSHTVLRWLDLDPGVERSFLGLCWLWCWPHPTYLEGQGMMGIQVDLLWWFRVTLLQLFCTQIKKCFSWLQEVLLSLDNSFTDICNRWSEGKMLFFGSKVDQLELFWCLCGSDPNSNSVTPFWPKSTKSWFWARASSGLELIQPVNLLRTSLLFKGHESHRKVNSFTDCPVPEPS